MKIVLLSIFSLICYQSISQTCCTAGAPLLSNNLVIGDKPQSIYFQYAYRSIQINRLVDNSMLLVNDPRTRSSKLISLSLAIPINNKISIGAIVPYRIQERATFSESQRSTGIGDPRLNVQYKFVDKPSFSFIQILGFDLPIGTSSNLDDRSIFLSPDMQPGSGSFDYYTSSLLAWNRILGTSFYSSLNLTYNYNTTNTAFGNINSSRSFKFGNELISQWTIKHESALKFGFLIPDVSLLYRYSETNEEQNFTASNSGGHWLGIQFGMYIKTDYLPSLRLYYYNPLKENISGLQITTSSEWGIEISHTISYKKDQNSLPNNIIKI